MSRAEEPLDADREMKKDKLQKLEAELERNGDTMREKVLQARKTAIDALKEVKARRESEEGDREKGSGAVLDDAAEPQDAGYDEEAFDD